MGTLLDVCAGIGGFSLAFKHLVGGWRTVGYVEIDRYCREVLRARIREGWLDDAPIFHDLRDFSGQPYRGKVDLVTAGFPCQPFSTAARGRNKTDRLYQHLVRVVDEISPRWVFFENVSAKAFPAPLRNYLYRIPASAVGAPHRRFRYWLLANTNGYVQPHGTVNDEVARMSAFIRINWWEKPLDDFRGVDDGFTAKVDRARAFGNAVVPAVVAKAWEILNQ